MNPCPYGEMPRELAFTKRHFSQDLREEVAIVLSSQVNYLMMYRRNAKL
jgi:hypothetical protein